MLTLVKFSWDFSLSSCQFVWSETCKKEAEKEFWCSLGHQFTKVRENENQAEDKHVSNGGPGTPAQISWVLLHLAPSRWNVSHFLILRTSGLTFSKMYYLGTWVLTTKNIHLRRFLFHSHLRWSGRLLSKGIGWPNT